MMALINPGDEVIIPSPYWVSYPEQVKLCGGVPVFVRGEESRDFKISPQQLEEAIAAGRGRTRAFIINSPSNPGGHTYSPAELKSLADVMLKHPEIVVLSDEIYENLIYGDTKTASFASLDPRLLDRTLTFSCHSKSFAMTGWRVGYVGGPQHIIDAMNKMQSQTTSHITSFAQIPAALALDDPRGTESIEAMRKQFERRGQHMWKRLVELPQITCVKPTGAFYCFPNVSKHFGKRACNGQEITDAASFASALLEQNHVAVVPGNDSGFDTHLRLSFATSMEQINEGIDRIAKFLESLK